MSDSKHSDYYLQALKSATDYILVNDYVSAMSGYNAWIKQFGRRLTDEETEEIFKYFQSSKKWNNDYKALLKKVP